VGRPKPRKDAGALRLMLEGAQNAIAEQPSTAIFRRTLGKFNR